MKVFGFENQYSSDYTHHTDEQSHLDRLKDFAPEYLRLLLSQRSREGQYRRRLRRLGNRRRDRTKV